MVKKVFKSREEVKKEVKEVKEAKYNSTLYSSSDIESDFDEDDEYIFVLYNMSYGGFDLSEKAEKLYNKELYDYERRYDPDLIKIYKKLGSEINGEFSSIIAKKIPKIYRDYIIIDEYDGMESVTINYDKYNLDTIKNIIENDENNDEKIKKIKQITELLK
jgi:hypothetical protein